MTEPTAYYVIEIIAIGIVATLVTDIWQRLLQAIAGLPPARWGLIGRWVAGFPRGAFVRLGIPLCDRHRLGRPLWCDHEVRLGLRSDARFRAGRFTRATRRALVRHATRARRFMATNAAACRGSRNEGCWRTRFLGSVFTLARLAGPG